VRNESVASADSKSPRIIAVAVCLIAALLQASVAACCSELQLVAVRCSEEDRCCSVFIAVLSQASSATRCSALRCVAARMFIVGVCLIIALLQASVAVCCSVLQSVAAFDRSAFA